MKKLISVLLAVILPITMLTGCSKKLSKEEYKKQVPKLIDQFISTALSDEVTSSMKETLDTTRSNGFDKDALNDLKVVCEKEFAEANKYLDQLEQINPPEEMADCHESLLDIITKVRDFEEKLIAVYSAKSEDKLNSAAEKLTSSADSLDKKLEKLLKNEEWLYDELEDADFMDALDGVLF